MPCLLSSSMVDLALRSLILLLDMFIIRKRGNCCRLANIMPKASYPKTLKERFRFVTPGISSTIRLKPSFVRLFFTSFRPLIFLRGFKYLKTSTISESERE